MDGHGKNVARIGFPDLAGPPEFVEFLGQKLPMSVLGA
jgi:hypothetical protein